VSSRPGGKARPRVDLDGLALHAPGSEGPAIAVLRYRTTAGLVLLMPESAEFLVRWEDLGDVALDLRAGVVRIEFQEAYAARENWLRGARLLEGRWVDRLELDPEALGLSLG
jgi:hypothetical protein